MKYGVKKNGRSTERVWQIKGKVTLPMILTSIYHSPVLLPEVLDSLKVAFGKKYIDATLGGAGYSREIVKHGGRVLGIDQDADAIDYVRAQEIGSDLIPVRGNFRNLKKIAHLNNFEGVAGVLFDLGMSTYQLERSGRGFSFVRDEPLDMRMDKRNKLKAADIINSYTAEGLYEIFTKFSEELNSRTIADALVRARSLRGPILRTVDLVEVIDGVCKKIFKGINDSFYREKRNSTLARVFQALRIVVNDEIESLNSGLKDAVDLLLGGGRLVVLSYHSLEDRIIKLKFKEFKSRGLLKIITKKPITPSWDEIAVNPKARSAKMRIAQKL